MSPASKAAGDIFVFSGGYNPLLNTQKIAPQFWQLVKATLEQFTQRNSLLKLSGLNRT